MKSLEVRIDSIFKYSDTYYDSVQKGHIWDIADLPDVTPRDDDQFFELRKSDRLDIIAHKMLGDVRYMFIIMHYNDIPDATELDNWIGRRLRLPSRATLERIFLNADERGSYS